MTSNQKQTLDHQRFHSFIFTLTTDKGFFSQKKTSTNNKHNKSSILEDRMGSKIHLVLVLDILHLF